MKTRIALFAIAVVTFMNLVFAQDPLLEQLEGDIAFSVPPYWTIGSIDIVDAPTSIGGLLNYEFQVSLSASTDLYRLDQGPLGTLNAVRVAESGEVVILPGRITSVQVGDAWQNEVVFRVTAQPLAGNPLDRLPRSGITVESQIQGSVGLMNVERIVETNALSSFGLRYETEFRICEMNLQAGRWLSLPRPPYFLDFLRITSRVTGNESHCILIGTFNDPNHPERLLLVPPTVMSELDPGVYGEASVSVGLWSRSELTEEALRLAQLYALPDATED